MLPAKETQVRFFKSLCVGAFAAVVRVGTVPLFDPFLTPKQTFTVSYLLSVATHYTLNRFWALRSERTDWARQFVEYVMTAILGYGLQYVVFAACFYKLGLSQIWSNLISIPPSTLVVIAILNYRVFRQGAASRA